MAEGSLVQYGSPLEPLDEDNLKPAKAIKLSDQIVTDERGKRRFHGAFTGGFSAGYFNSVGSKEGWTPSTFVSSRSKRAEKKTNDPVSYMDEEDLSDFGIASRRIQATSNYDDPKTQNKRNRPEESTGPIPGKPVLEEILKPVNITIGMKFLMKLGWKAGQGVGPRISRLEKRRIRKEKKNSNKTYVIQVHESDESSSDAEDERDQRSSMGYAPDDVEDCFAPAPKSDVFGLGYKPLERGNVLGGLRDHSVIGPSFRVTDKRKKLNIRGQAFGIGAFEDEDEDIYSKEDMSDYDFTLGPKAQPSKKNRGRSRWDSQISLMGEVLEGFHLSSKPVPKTKSYPLPSLPSDFKPWHQSYKRRFEKVTGENPNERPSAEMRKRLVSNTPTIEVRSGLKKEKESQVSGQDSGANMGDPAKESSEAASNLRPVSDYRPFAAYPEKQKRYEAFLSAKGKAREEIFPTHMTDWEREREREEFIKAEAFKKPLSFTMSSRFTTASFEDKGTILSEGLNTMKGNLKFYQEAKRPHHRVEELAEDMKAAKEKMFGKLTQTQCDWHPDRLLCRRFNVPNPYPQSSKVGVQTSQREKISIFNFLSEMPPPPQGDGTSRSSPSHDNSVMEVEVEEDYGLKVPVSDTPTVDLYKAIFQDSSESETDEKDPKMTDEERGAPSTIEKGYENGSSPLSTQKERDFKSTSGKERAKDSCRPSVRNIRPKVVDDEENKAQEPFKSEVAEVSTDVAAKAKGIFRGIDFSALNEYRTLKQSSETSLSATKGNTTINLPSTRERRKSRSSSSSDQDSDSESPVNECSSDNSEDAYGPALPPHMLGSKEVLNTVEEKKNFSLKTLPTPQSLKEIEKKLKKSKKSKKKSKHKHKKKKSKKKDYKHSK